MARQFLFQTVFFSSKFKNSLTPLYSSCTNKLLTIRFRIGRLSSSLFCLFAKKKKSLVQVFRYQVLGQVRGLTPLNLALTVLKCQAECESALDVRVVGRIYEWTQGIGIVFVCDYSFDSQLNIVTFHNS